MPDPKSFDTLEKAQAEIARLQALIWALAIAAGGDGLRFRVLRQGRARAGGAAAMSDTTYDTCVRLTNEARARELAEERQALAEPTIASACAKGYQLACKDLYAAQVNLQAFTRGMIGAQLLPSYIAEAREALCRIEQALVTP